MWEELLKYAFIIFDHCREHQNAADYDADYNDYRTDDGKYIIFEQQRCKRTRRENFQRAADQKGSSADPLSEWDAVFFGYTLTMVPMER